MRKMIEQFLKGYRLAYDNILFFSSLSSEKRTYEIYLERMEWQRSRLSGLDGFSRFGGWICVVLHFSQAVRMHLATNQMLKDKQERKLS
ncbi:MAG: hypothetical protein WCT49_02295 [Candidatus Paceibacterota bacterium]